MWDLQTGKLEHSLVTPREQKNFVFGPQHQTYIGRTLFLPALWNTLVFALDGKTLFSGRHAKKERDSKEPGVEQESVLVSGDETGVLRLCVVATGYEIGRMEGHTRTIYAVSFSPDGKTLASASEDGTVRLTDVATRTLRGLLPHDRPATSVAFSPNGKLVATGSLDGKVRLWNSKDGRLLLTLQVFPSHDNSPPGAWIAYTPDGYYDASQDIKDFLRWRVGNDLFFAAKFERTYHRPDRVRAALQGKWTCDVQNGPGHMP